MKNLLESLFVLVTPMLLATPKRATKKKAAPKKRTARMKKPRTPAAHGLTSDSKPTIGK